MKLTKLELSGFKSFADTVTLSFGEGVTAIVGPNGCGKSNVSDAVRWVLGEQSARLLRGGKMEDVIFQGAAGRRPVNVTEVSLFLDNTEGDLPIAYREVQITRRLSRSGQSDYLLNGALVRLRDIQDLLRGTGLGSDAGVVIEAKMIELLLSDRAEERRSLFEEAAGNRPLPRPQADHRASSRGDRRRPAARRGPDRRSPEPDPEPRQAAGKGREVCEVVRREVLGAAHPGSPPAGAPGRPDCEQ
jgi:energy-coupling factor transporter ATP-binding protein EcfA2